GGPGGAGGGAAEPREEVGTLLRRLGEQRRRTQGSRPRAVGGAEQRRQRLPQLLRAEGIGLEERELPPVERLGERSVGVCRGQSTPDLQRDLGAELVEARGLAERRRRRDR